MPLAIPNIEIIDKADGTGITLNVSQVEPTSDLFFRYQPWSGELGGNPFVTHSAFDPEPDGTGTYDIELEPGLYWGYLQQSVELTQINVSRMVFFAVTDGIESVHYRCLIATQARIVGMNLPGIEPGSIVVDKVPLDEKFGEGRLRAFPGVLISPGGNEEMNPLRGVNAFDDVVYPVNIALLNNDNRDQQAGLEVRLKWRERIARAFRNQRLPGVPEVWNCEVQPWDIIQPDAFQKNIFLSLLTLKFVSREPRGL